MTHWQAGLIWVGGFITFLGFVLGITTKVLSMMLTKYPNWEEARSEFQSIESCGHFHKEQDIRNQALVEQSTKQSSVLEKLSTDVQSIKENFARVLALWEKG